MKNLLYIIIGLTVLAGCDDGVDKTKPHKPQVYPRYTNDFRAAEIEGRNKYWGEFKLLFEYTTADQLANVWRVDAERDTVGRISVMRGTDQMVDRFNVQDWIPNISPDSIDRMDKVYLEKYGAGNYSLKDSIPLVARNVIECTNYFYTDSRIYQQEFMYYRPRENVGVTGVNFNNEYLQTRKVRYMYEYNDQGRVAIVRWGEYTYPDPAVPSEFDTRQGKCEVGYHDASVSWVDAYEQIGGGSYGPATEYRMSYDGARLRQVAAEGYEKTFSYSGSECTVTEEGKIWKYTLDTNGYPVRQENPAGEYMTVKYEEGNGDFEILTPFLERLMGNPYIK